MATAHINPDVLRWAMERADKRADDLAAAFKKRPETIAAWMEGQAAPTFKQAQKLAQRLRVPFGYLFLAAPPVERLPLPDFRRHPDAREKPSVDLRDTISDVLRKQDWYREFRMEAEAEPTSFVGRFELGDNVVAVAADIRQAIDFENEVRPESQTAQFLRVFVLQVEAAGVLVMRNGVVRQATNRALAVDEFRGFSIADAVAPAIFINNADSSAAQVFTLAHELAHIWIGEGGISDADVTITDDEGHIEEYCNRVAGELLLPWDEVARRWAERRNSLGAWISDVARDYHVSTVMVARQLWEHEAIDRELFFDFYETEKEKWTERPKGSGGNFYLNIPIRNSRLLTEAVIETVHTDPTSIRDASRLLGVKPANLSKLEESMARER